MDEDLSERLVADRTGENASSRVIAYGLSPGMPPVPARGSGPQGMMACCRDDVLIDKKW